MTRVKIFIDEQEPVERGFQVWKLLCVLSLVIAVFALFNFVDDAGESEALAGDKDRKTHHEQNLSSIVAGNGERFPYNSWSHLEDGDNYVRGPGDPDLKTLRREQLSDEWEGREVFKHLQNVNVVVASDDAVDEGATDEGELIQGKPGEGAWVKGSKVAGTPRDQAEAEEETKEETNDTD